jgi:3-hydroxyisobutyrate dehydrogenase-like beta-hydroxyacid dehydrogenase
MGGPCEELCGGSVDWPFEPRPSDEGSAVIVETGANKAVERARPLIDAFSRGIIEVSNSPHQAYAMKLGP